MNRAVPWFDSALQPKREAEGMIALAASPDYSIAHLRAEIGDSNEPRRKVLAQFDKLVREGKVAAIVKAAIKRSRKQAQIIARQMARERKNREPHNVLTEEIREHIRQLSDEGFSQSAIAERFHVSQTTIGRALRQVEGDQT